MNLSLRSDFRKRISSPEWHNEADRTHWREVLRSFNNVKTLHMQYGLLGELSRSLQPQDGEPPLELLPELKEIHYDEMDGPIDPFKASIDARQDAGQPIVLARSPTSLYF